MTPVGSKVRGLGHGPRQRLAHQGDDGAVLIKQVFRSYWGPFDRAFDVVAKGFPDGVDETKSNDLAFEWNGDQSVPV